MSILIADAIFWVAVACCTVAQLAIFRSILVTPATASAGSSSTRRRTAEIAWAVLPGVALGVVLFYTWAAIHAPTASALPTITP